MSGYTISEIVIWMLLAAVLGFALGWLTRELVQRRHKTSPAPEPEPLPEPEPEPLPSVDAGPHPGSALPVAGGAPPSAEFIIKVSRGSKIYHAPSSSAYGRTTAAMWFASAEAAEAAGFRKPKNA